MLPGQRKSKRGQTGVVLRSMIKNQVRAHPEFGAQLVIEYQGSSTEPREKRGKK